MIILLIITTFIKAIKAKRYKEARLITVKSNEVPGFNFYRRN